MKHILRVFLSALVFLALTGCGSSDNSGSSEVMSSTSTKSDQQEQAQLKASLKKQADQRAKADAECRKVIQNAYYHQALSIITSIPQCVAAIRAGNANAVFMNCKDDIKLVGDLAVACLLGGKASKPEEPLPSCYGKEKPKSNACRA
ncbi:MAG: hypothetical protein AB7T49_11245 [Oligoflexales bacterium]